MKVIVTKDFESSNHVYGTHNFKVGEIYESTLVPEFFSGVACKCCISNYNKDVFTHYLPFSCYEELRKHKLKQL